ncbi:MAG: type II toxin-antitoxin system VapC family toxin [Anaerolineales bacterium]
MILYLDTSALIKRYVNETGSPDVREWLRSADDKATVLITRAEMSAALNRLLRMKFLSQNDHASALAEFRADWMYYHRLPITEPLVARADALACEHNLRGYDAIHLAAALTWQDLLGLPVTVVTYDKELTEAARALGMEVLPEKQ